MAEEPKSQDGADEADDASRPAEAHFDPRGLAAEVMATSPSSAFRRPTASAVEAARQPVEPAKQPTLTDPIELEAARQRTIGGPPSSELGLVNLNSPSLPPPAEASRPITLLDDDELSPLDRAWMDDGDDDLTASPLPNEQPTAPPPDGATPADAKSSEAPTAPPPPQGHVDASAPAPVAPAPAVPRIVLGTTDDMFAEIALEDAEEDGELVEDGPPITLDADSGEPSTDAPRVTPPPPSSPLAAMLVAREPSGVLNLGDTPSSSALTTRDPGSLVAQEPSLFTPVSDPPPMRASALASGSHADMKERFSLGDYTGALEIAESLLADSPDDEVARECADHSRGVLIQMYTTKVGPLDRVPMVMVPREQLRWLSIDHRAGFVLSHIDGMSSLEMILDVSGMAPLDALRILSELHQQRIISFR